MPYMLNTDELNWGAKMGFFWAGLCGICAVYTYFRVPEPRGRTYGASPFPLALFLLTAASFPGRLSDSLDS